MRCRIVVTNISYILCHSNEPLPTRKYVSYLLVAIAETMSGQIEPSCGCTDFTNRFKRYCDLNAINMYFIYFQQADTLPLCE